MSDTPTKMETGEPLWFVDQSCKKEDKSKVLEILIVDEPVEYTKISKDLLFILADGYMLRNRLIEVNSIYKEIINHQNPITNCACMFILRKTPEEVKSYWESTYPKDKKRPIAYFLAIEAYFKLQKYNEAIILYEEGKSSFKQASKSKLFENFGKYIGEAYLKAGKYKECKEFVYNEISINSQKRDVSVYKETLALCGLLLNEEKLIIDNEKDSFNIQIIHAKYYYRNKNYSQALLVLEEMLHQFDQEIGNNKELDPMQKVKLIALKADVLFTQKNYIMAEKEYYEAKLLNKEIGDSADFTNKLLFSYGKALFHNQNYSEALEQFKSCQITSRKCHLYIIKAELLCKSNNFVDSVNKIKEVEKDNVLSIPIIECMYKLEDYIDHQNSISIQQGIEKLLSVPNLPDQISCLISTIQSKPCKLKSSKSLQMDPMQIYTKASLASLRNSNDLALFINSLDKFKLLSKILLHMIPEERPSLLTCTAHCSAVMYALYRAKCLGYGSIDLLEEHKIALAKIYNKDSRVEEIMREMDKC